MNRGVAVGPIKIPREIQVMSAEVPFSPQCEIMWLLPYLEQRENGVVCGQREANFLP